MAITYESSRPIEVAQFADLLRRSTLAERRPVDDSTALESMLRHANLLCTAWDDDRLVGVARALTDYQFCCYLSDLAVDRDYQRRGIGRKLIAQVRAKLGGQAKIILLAAPAAESYYPRVGFVAHRSAWTLSADDPLT